eukprot:CAMPEP_0203801048 /NCGR_PEP_ID=MMETSP0100_2-20121128/11001_1 /ASSEMBLY_ACC=CAM_ASM_000210 /TAXON_ID=96639 /ORGANISM=" , Strain NY0313808BC1" /LENGTH=57 /DNA_ID=CAMNT_0050707489 /DNA_START=653 /DNA_END=823 /DNA_ORIENTATION=+
MAKLARWIMSPPNRKIFIVRLQLPTPGTIGVKLSCLKPYLRRANKPDHKDTDVATND